MTNRAATTRPRPTNNPSRQYTVAWLLAGATVSGAVLGLGFGRVVAQPPSAAVVAESTTVDGLAAVLGGADPLEPTRTILQSDVELRARISLLGLGNERALFGELPRSLLRATLDELIGEHLIAIEAERVKITPPSPVDVQRELIEVEREAGGQHWLARLTSWLGATDSELTQLAERRALIGAFLRANLEGVSVVTDAEVDARLRDDWASYIAESPESARVTVRAILAKDALRRTIEHWVRVLRARTRVRVFAAYEAS